MRVIEAFKKFNAENHDVEKYYLRWLRVLDSVKRLGFESYVCQLCVILIYAFLCDILECLT